jgi:hypothetical protein
MVGKQNYESRDLGCTRGKTTGHCVVLDKMRHVGAKKKLPLKMPFLRIQGILYGWDLAEWLESLTQCQRQSRNSPGFYHSILRHSEIWGAADEAVLNKVP